MSFSTPPSTPPGPLLLPLTGELSDLNTDRPGVRGELGPLPIPVPVPAADAGSPSARPLTLLGVVGEEGLEKLWPKGSQLRGCECWNFGYKLKGNTGVGGLYIESNSFIGHAGLVE